MEKTRPGGKLKKYFVFTTAASITLLLTSRSSIRHSTVPKVPGLFAIPNDDTLSPQKIVDIVEMELPSKWDLDKVLATVDFYATRSDDFENTKDYQVIDTFMKTMCRGVEPPVVMVSGVNQGQGSSYILESCPSALLHGFEIQEREFQIATELFANKPNVKIYHKGVSNKIGHLMVAGDGVLAGLYKPSARWQGAKQQGLVEIVTPSSFVEEMNIARVDYYLIDVEGHEQEVIKGMELEKNAHKFPVFQYELGGTWADSRRSGPWTQFSIALYLQLLGYDIYLMGYWDDKAALLPTPPEFYRLSKTKTEGFSNGGQKYFVQGNALCVHKEHAPDAVKAYVDSIRINVI